MEEGKHTMEGRKRKGKPYKREWDISGKKAARDSKILGYQGISGKEKGNGKEGKEEGKKNGNRKET